MHSPIEETPGTLGVAVAPHQASPIAHAPGQSECVLEDTPRAVALVAFPQV